MIIGIDLGGTKLSLAVFTEEGKMLHKETTTLNNRTGKQVGQLITTVIKELVIQEKAVGNIIRSIGIAVPGISRSKTGTVWAPNIPGWDDAIYLAIGTGIGAVILSGGRILRGAHDIAGAIGWMALSRPFDDKYIS